MIHGYAIKIDARTDSKLKFNPLNNYYNLQLFGFN